MSKDKKNKRAYSPHHSPVRRRICQLGLITGLGTAVPVLAQPAERMRPQAGDLLVFDGGPLDGRSITPGMLTLNQQPVAAFPKDPATGIVRSRNRLNRVMITRLAVDELDADTRANAAAGVIAYSAVCTHTGCDVENWEADQLRMRCPCHESEFSVRDNGRVVGGPAPRPLAMLPLTLQGGILQVRDGFTSRVGFQEQF